MIGYVQRAPICLNELSKVLGFRVGVVEVDKLFVGEGGRTLFLFLAFELLLRGPSYPRFTGFSDWSILSKIQMSFIQHNRIHQILRRT